MPNQDGVAVSVHRAGRTPERAHRAPPLRRPSPGLDIGFHHKGGPVVVGVVPAALGAPDLRRDQPPWCPQTSGGPSRQLRSMETWRTVPRPPVSSVVLLAAQ